MSTKPIIDYSGYTHGVAFGYLNGDPNAMWRTIGSEVEWSVGADTFVLTNFDDIFFASNKPTFVNAGAGNDNINGGTGADRFLGGAGNDRLRGGGGSDDLAGGSGDDELISDGVDRRLIGGEGIDTVNFIDAARGVFADLANHRAFLLDEQVTQSDAGGQNANRGQGTDNLAGGKDKATRVESVLGSMENLTGSNFNDQLIGDRNANRINGGRGQDDMTGGEGKDTFVFSSPDFGKIDVIRDFTGEDILEFSRSIFTDYSAVKAAAKDTVFGVQINSHGNTILLIGVTTADLTEQSIHIVA